VELTVALVLNIDFNTDTPAPARQTLPAQGYDLRYIVDLYPLPHHPEAPLAQRERRLIATAAALPANGIYRFRETLTLPAAQYCALVWVDCVPHGSRDDYYYLTENLQAVTINPARPYQGYHPSRDALTASLVVDLRPEQNPAARFEATLPVQRPFALYRIVATDVQQYRAAHPATRPATTQLHYEAWFPMGYNAYRSVPGHFCTGVHYSCPVPETTPSDTEVELAADFVPVNSTGDFYHTSFDIRTPAGELLVRHTGIRINLQRNRLTVLRGAFLTTGSGTGGTGVDFNFDEEIIVFI
jgi:hypothetical protein